MKNILFICSSLEPGEDGVGDYTRRLACALVKKGYKASIIAINDRRMQAAQWQGKQTCDNIDVKVIRLNAMVSWRKRLQIARQFADEFDAGYISLQYVPFGYHLKGLPFNLASGLKRIGKGKYWHIMFHELTVKKEESLKFQLWGSLQEIIIRSLVKQLLPVAVSTNTEVYRQRLAGMGFETCLLPLFSNISNLIMEYNISYEAIVPVYLQQHRQQYIIGTLFGSFDAKSWDLHSLLAKFTYRFSHKRIVIASVGRMPAGRNSWNELQYHYPQVLFISFGEQEAGFISYWLQHYTDFGILATLPELAGKSGSFMAFKEHGIPIVCRERTSVLELYGADLDKALTVISKEKNFAVPARFSSEPALDSVVSAFISQLRFSEIPSFNSASIYV